MTRIRVHHVPQATPNVDSVPTEYDVDRATYDDIRGYWNVCNLWDYIERKFPREGMFIVKVTCL